MPDTDEVFPFPPLKDDLKDERDLPPFPPASPSELSNTEIDRVRTMLSWFEKQNIGCSTKERDPDKAISAQTDTSMKSRADSRRLFIDAFDGIKVENPHELEYKNNIRKYLTDLADEHLIRIGMAIASIFPIYASIRHGTPDQKLFFLIASTDRFLGAIQGMRFTERAALIRATADLASGISGQYRFISEEGKPFDVRCHERVAKSATGGSLIREIHGFLVIRNESSQVARRAQVLT